MGKSRKRKEVASKVKPKKPEPHLVLDIVFNIAVWSHKETLTLPGSNYEWSDVKEHVSARAEKIEEELAVEPDKFDLPFGAGELPEGAKVSFAKITIKESFHNPSLKVGDELFGKEVHGNPLH